MSANAAILLDQSFDTTGKRVNEAFSNTATFINYVDDAAFASPVDITGISIFTNALAAVGQNVVVKIFGNTLGSPGPLLFKISEKLDAVDSQFTTTQTLQRRAHATLTSPVQLGAGTYWFGLSGNGNNLTQLSLFSSITGHGKFAVQLFSDSFSQTDPELFSVLALQVEGNLSAVPVPAAVWLLGSVLSGLGFTRRRLHCR